MKKKETIVGGQPPADRARRFGRPQGVEWRGASKDALEGMLRGALPFTSS
jgi:hypothetical protein